ncbi:MAG: hypothetical protein P8M80_07885 [Pirellulaceae bacterium]|nr:hypothetical protein [Pirellulaceae bacterium]
MSLKKVRNHKNGSAKYLCIETIWEGPTRGLGWLKEDLYEEFDEHALIGYRVSKKGKLKFDSMWVAFDENYFLTKGEAQAA